MGSKFSVEGIFRAKDRLSGILASVETRASKFARNTSRAFKDLDKVNMALIGSFAKLAPVVAGAGVAAGIALGAAGAAGADFEEAITAVGAVSLMSRDQIAELEQKALELGATTKFSATEVANAMEMMGRAGFTNAETMAGVGGILSAAAAEGAGLEETASHVSNVLKGMGLAAGESGRVADVLTLASARTNSSISSLGESMKNVASTARQLNVPLESTVAAVALLQDVGLDASEAGSAVNTMLTQMAAPSDAAKASMKRLGVSFQDAAGNMLPFEEVLGQLRKSAEKSGGNMAQVAFFAELVGLRGQKAAANLQELFKGDKGGKVGELTRELKGAAGAAEQMAGFRMQNLKGDIEQLGGAVDGVKIALFNTQSGPLRGVVQGMTDWINANQGLNESEFVGFVNRATFALSLFSDGARSGFEAVRDGANLVLGPIGKVAGVFGDAPEWTTSVATLGKVVGAGAPIFIGYAVAVKGATLVIGTYEIATKAATLATGAIAPVARGAAAATTALSVATTGSTVAANASTAAERLKAAALAFGRIATTRYTLATVASGVATRASAVATRLWTGAVTLYTIATNRSAAATVASTIATRAGQVAQVASNAARAIGTGALNLYAIARGRATVAETAGAASAAAANLALAPLLVTLGAITAAVGSLILAWQQWQGLQKAAGGAEGLAAGWESFKKGEGFFKGVDENFNKRAREEFAREQAAKGTAPQVVSPQDRVASSINESRTESVDKTELTIKDKTGGRAEVTKPGKGKVPIKMKPSGAFG
jgi:TP901 family phage tail tape measure protein